MKNPLQIVFGCMLLLACGSSKSTTSAPTTNTSVIESNANSNPQEVKKEARIQLIEDLNLREDQRQAVQIIVQERQERLQEIQSQGGDRRSKFQQMRTVSQEMDIRLKEVLDSEQYKIYEAYKQEQRQERLSQMRQGRNNRF